MTSISTNYNGYIPAAGTSSTTSTSDTKKTDAEQGLFSVPEETTSAEELQRQNKKQTLEAELAQYQAKKQELESQLKQYTDYQNKLREKKTQLQEREKNLQENIEKMESEKKQTQLDAEKLKADYDKNNASLLSLIQKMNEKISDTADKSAKAVQDRQKKIESAQNEAFKLVQEGKLDENEVADYIANKSGNPGIIKAMMQSGVSVVESMSSQIKGLIAQMSGTLNTMNEKKLKIESLSSEIMSKEDEKSIVSNEITLVGGEIDAVQVHIDKTQTKITAVDSDINNVQGEITSLDDPATDISTVGTNTPPPASGQREEIQEDAFVKPNFGAFTMKLNDMENPTQASAKKNGDNSQGDAGKNPFLSVTSTIDYSGFKTLLDTVMEQNSASINGLKNSVDANNKMLDQKPKMAA